MRKSKKICFIASISDIENDIETFKKIRDLINCNGSELIVDWVSEWGRVINKRDFCNEEKDRYIKKELFYERSRNIQHCDAVIAEITRPTIGVGYQMFYAEVHKKPILAIYNKNRSDLDCVNKVINVKSTNLQLSSYSKNNLSKIISQFLDENPFKLKKFNFIISKKISNYLDWLKLNNPQKTKSELLRNKIHSIIDNDQNYK